MSDVILQVSHLSKSFGNNEVLKDIDFSVCPGDVTSIIGASGSGKSTLLRCINLLETPLRAIFFITARASKTLKGERQNTALMSVWCSSRSIFLRI